MTDCDCTHPRTQHSGCCGHYPCTECDCNNFTNLTIDTKPIPTQPEANAQVGAAVRKLLAMVLRALEATP
jgi:hypothetical protein